MCVNAREMRRGGCPRAVVYRPTNRRYAGIWTNSVGLGASGGSEVDSVIVPIESSPGELSPNDASAIGAFLMEMVLLERAVDRALLDQYSREETRQQFIEFFLNRKTLGPKCEALIGVMDQIYDVDEAAATGFAAQLRELVGVRNIVAHKAPSLHYQVEHRDRVWTGSEWDEGEVVSRATYETLNLDAGDLLQMASLSVHVRSTISKHMHRPLVIDDPNDDDLVQ